MAIPEILQNLLDYDDLNRRRQAKPGDDYIWAKKNKVEEMWAACALLGLIVDRNVTVNGRALSSTYIFAPKASVGGYGNRWDLLYHNNTHGYMVAIGVGGRLSLTILHEYFKYYERRLEAGADKNSTDI